MSDIDKDKSNSLIQVKLCIIFELRNSLIELYPEVENSEKYIIANELLNELENLIRKSKSD